MANHNELIGGFTNGKTAVANNEQIIVGIRQAAYEGFKMALAEMDGFGNTNVNVSLQGDAERIFQVVRDEYTAERTRVGRPIFW